MLVISIVSLMSISLATPAPDQEAIQEVVFDRTTWGQESREIADKPWYRNYRWLALALVVLTVAVVVPFI